MRYVIMVLIPILLGFSGAPMDPVRVAVIDTGINYTRARNLCPAGHKDFTGKGLYDANGHGTNVSGLIDKNVGSRNYCQVIIKYFHDKGDEYNVVFTSNQAFSHAIDMGVDIINFSSVGFAPNKLERELVKKALDRGIIIITPSSNRNLNLDDFCNVFPACYDERIVVIGNSEGPTGKGRIVDAYVSGKNKYAWGVTMSGASQATAITTGKYIKHLTK